jgi:hypothetical protein
MMVYRANSKNNVFLFLYHFLLFNELRVLLVRPAVHFVNFIFFDEYKTGAGGD